MNLSAVDTVSLRSESLESLDVISTWLRGRGPCTLRAYKTDMAYFATYLGAATRNEAAQRLLSLPAGHANRLVLEYRATLVESGLTPNTINRRLATLRSLTKLARTIGLITWALEVENVRSTPYRDTRGPDVSGIKQIVRRIGERQDDKGTRDAAIILLLHDIALRCGELTSLDLSDYDPANRTLAVLGKGQQGKRRLSLPQRTNSALAAWIERRGHVPGPLFVNVSRNPTVRGTRITKTSVFRLVQRLGVEVEIPDLAPHKLRHSAITTACVRAQKAGLGIEKVLPFSRHAKLATLQVYIDNHENFQKQVADLVAE